MIKLPLGSTMAFSGGAESTPVVTIGHKVYNCPLDTLSSYVLRSGKTFCIEPATTRGVGEGISAYGDFNDGGQARFRCENTTLKHATEKFFEHVKLEPELAFVFRGGVSLTEGEAHELLEWVKDKKTGVIDLLSFGTCRTRRFDEAGSLNYGSLQVQIDQESTHGRFCRVEISPETLTRVLKWSHEEFEWQKSGHER